MDYVFDFVRLLGSRDPSRRAQRTFGLASQVRLVLYGLLLGMMMPVIRQIDWHALLPAGMTIVPPTLPRIEWPAAHIDWPGTLSPMPSAGTIAAAGTAIAARVASRGGQATETATGPAFDAGPTTFRLCDRARRINCVIDGDTFWMRGSKIRVADIDAPETHPSRCAREARLGNAATMRFRSLLNAGPVTLVRSGRDIDRYGRKLRLVERDGGSLGQILVREGLARRYDGGKRAGWCGWRI